MSWVRQLPVVDRSEYRITDNGDGKWRSGREVVPHEFALLSFDGEQGGREFAPCIVVGRTSNSRTLYVSFFSRGPSDGRARKGDRKYGTLRGGNLIPVRNVRDYVPLAPRS